MYVKLLIISAIFLSAAFFLLGIRMLIKRGSNFPETRAGHNNEMRKRGISCARKTDTGCKPASTSLLCESCESE